MNGSALYRFGVQKYRDRTQQGSASYIFLERSVGNVEVREGTEGNVQRERIIVLLSIYSETEAPTDSHMCFCKIGL